MSATDDLNLQVGFTLFRMVARGQASDASVIIQALEGEDSPPPGRVIHQRTGERLIGAVHIRSDIASVDRTLYLVAEHEYLHLAGLKHDDFTLSVMFPITREDWDLAVMGTAHVTDYDISLLQGLYRP